MPLIILCKDVKSDDDFAITAMFMMHACVRWWGRVASNSAKGSRERGNPQKVPIGDVTSSIKRAEGRQEVEEGQFGHTGLFLAHARVHNCALVC